jgi:tetratricopeptide (TPR) repeat protein
MGLGHAAADGGEWQRARDYYERAIDLCRELGDELGVAGVLGDLAGLLIRAGQAREALPIAAESVELQRRLGFEQGVSLVQATQAYAYLMTGEHERARELLLDSLRIAHRFGYQHGLVYCLNGLGRLAYELGEFDGAATAFAAAQRLRTEIGIEHDPDDALIAPARAAIEERLGQPVDAGDAAEVDLDELVAALVGEA